MIAVLLCDILGFVSPVPVSPPAKISTHQRILQAAKTLFSSRGYEHASTSAIARQAGTSESQLMKHFGSKAGVLEAIFNEGWGQILEEARAASQNLTSPVQKLAAISACVLRRLETDPELKLLMLLEGRRIRREGPVVALTEGFLGFVGLLDGVIAEMRTTHVLRPELDPQAVRSALMGMLEGMMRDRYLADQVRFPADFQAGQLQEILGLVLRSFTVRAE
jgi:TetR/AcrR family transcriptional regulator, fatty acid metabolism regulator protein